MPLFTAMTTSLPALKSLADAADYNTVIQPYLSQLTLLPKIAASEFMNPMHWYALYKTTNPFVWATAMGGAVLPIAVFLLAEVTGNYSQVDRAWAILPTLYNMHYALWAHLNGVPAKRLDNIVYCSAFWSVRLTFNYWRRGGYQSGSEDYRWAIIQKRINNLVWNFFKIVFIAWFQNILFVLITLPTYVLLNASRLEPDMNVADRLAASTVLALVLFEFSADQQQWDYQEAKAHFNRTASPTFNSSYSRADLERGFVTKGWWAWSRHPAWAAEQSIWILYYVWACVQTGTMWNFAIVGPICYCMIFVGSTGLTEEITAGKYPEYARYQKQVAKFGPVPWKGKFKPAKDAGKKSTGAAKKEGKKESAKSK